MKTFEIAVRTASWANPPLARLSVEDKIYKILGTAAGACPESDYAPDACYVLMLVMDERDPQTEYLISTEDYIPHKIVHGSKDEMLGKTFDQAAGHDDFNIGTRFFLTEFRDRLILADDIKWDGNGNPWLPKR